MVQLQSEQLVNILNQYLSQGGDKITSDEVGTLIMESSKSLESSIQYQVR